MDDDRGAALAQRAAAAFQHLPGVHSVGIGGRTRGGKPTGDLVLVVYVLAKLPREQLTAETLVPAEFEGVSTDVVEAPSPQPAVAVPGAQLGGHRIGGPALLQTAPRAAYDRGLRVPETIEGRSADACLRDILNLFDRHGSPTLRADIRAYRDLLPPVAGRSYTEILEVLRESQGGQRWRS